MRLRRRCDDPRPTVLGPVEFGGRGPTFTQPGPDEFAKVFVVRVAGAIVTIESCLEGGAGRSNFIVSRAM